MDTNSNNGKIFIIKVHGWEEMFVKNGAMKDKDSFDKIISKIFSEHQECNTILLPPITKAERHKIHTYQRKNKMINTTIYKNDPSELRGMLITVTPKYIKELLTKFPNSNNNNSNNNNSNNIFNEQLESILNDFKNKVKDLLRSSKENN
jgi:hypothetical protein